MKKKREKDSDRQAYEAPGQPQRDFPTYECRSAPATGFFRKPDVVIFTNRLQGVQTYIRTEILGIYGGRQITEVLEKPLNKTRKS